MASVRAVRFRQLMQRQPDCAFVLAQRGTSRRPMSAVALARSPRFVQATRGIAAAVIDQRFIVDLAHDQPFVSLSSNSVPAWSGAGAGKAGLRSPACRGQPIPRRV